MLKRDFLSKCALIDFLAISLILSLNNKALADMKNQDISDGLILLKGGSFLMGSLAGERQRGEDEKQRQATISPFYIDPYETRQKDYEELMGSNPSKNKGANLPVENITWFDAILFCNAKSKK